MIQAELCAALNSGRLVLGGAEQHCRSVLPATVSTCTCSFAHSSISKLLHPRYIQLKISPQLSLQHCQQLLPARIAKTRLRFLASMRSQLLYRAAQGSFSLQHLQQLSSWLIEACVLFDSLMKQWEQRQGRGWACLTPLSSTGIETMTCTTCLSWVWRSSSPRIGKCWRP